MYRTGNNCIGELPDENPVEGNEEFQISTLESGTMFLRELFMQIVISVLQSAEHHACGSDGLLWNYDADDKLWYVYAIDSGTHNFRISNSGNYKIFVKNVSTGDVDLEGGYVSY